MTYYLAIVSYGAEYEFQDAYLRALVCTRYFSFLVQPRVRLWFISFPTLLTVRKVSGQNKILPFKWWTLYSGLDQLPDPKIIIEPKCNEKYERHCSIEDPIVQWFITNSGTYPFLSWIFMTFCIFHSCEFFFISHTGEPLVPPKNHKVFLILNTVDVIYCLWMSKI